MAKTVSMPIEEYEEDLFNSKKEGYSQGREQMITISRLIMDGKSEKVIVSDSTEDYVKEFIKDLIKLLEGK